MGLMQPVPARERRKMQDNLDGFIRRVFMLDLQLEAIIRGRRKDMDRRKHFQIRRYESLEAMKADEYQYWQQRPDHERIAAVSEITSEAYGLKGSRPDVPRLERTLVHLIRPKTGKGI